MNQALGNVGKTVIYTDPVEAKPVDQAGASLAALVKDMRDGAVDTLVILGGNPVYDAPADLDFLAALRRVNLRSYLGFYLNETAEWCHWHVPEAHYLESWSDARAWDGTASIVQPLIAPIYNGRTSHEVLNVLLNKADRSAHDTVREYWQMQHPSAPSKGADFLDFSRKTALHDGIVAGTAFPERKLRRRRAVRRPRRRLKQRASKLFSGPIPRSAPGRTPTMPGCKSCRNRRTRWPGRTLCGSRPLPRSGWKSKRETSWSSRWEGEGCKARRGFKPARRTNPRRFISATGERARAASRIESVSTPMP